MPVLFIIVLPLGYNKSFCTDWINREGMKHAILPTPLISKFQVYSENPGLHVVNSEAI